MNVTSRSSYRFMLMVCLLMSLVPHLKADDAAELAPSALEGFVVTKLYDVPKEQGSWVCITLGENGDLIVADQYDKGVFRVELTGEANHPVAVEKLPFDITAAQGLLAGKGELFVHANPKPFTRVFDSDGDGTLDQQELLPGSVGGGEHGNHAVIRAEDGKSIYVAAGNHTPLPQLAGSNVQTFDEDLLLPRQWDARGHARGVMSPGGWICRFDPQPKAFRLWCSGFRNQYDIALNRSNDLFTFDADMEWDMGTGWYRPTRICHAVSGADFGWRSGTGKWPAYFEDSLPAVIDLGPGSPTGVVAGMGAKFPAKYQDAIFALDWTFGTIYAVHLEVRGASYRGTAEPFVTGAPLPVTDAVIGNDGAMYFTTGGRRMASALYKVTYAGKENTAPVSRAVPLPNEAAKTRRQLEAFHGVQNPAAIKEAWPHLQSGDRFLRHAARVAIESQPVEQWAHRVFNETNPQSRISAAVALARVGKPVHRRAMLRSLNQLEPARLSQSQLLGLLRAYALNFIRLGKPTERERQEVVSKLEPMLPIGNADVDTELVRVLVYLESERVIPKTIELIINPRKPEIPEWAEIAKRNPRYGETIARMMDNYPPVREINYALMLRTARVGWTLPLRKYYFDFLNRAAKASGGASYAGFLTKIRDEALEHCSDEHRAELKELTGEDYNPVPDFEITPPAGPGRKWELPAALTASGDLKNCDFESGRNLFFAAQCGKCHRFAGLGGGVGPDLTSVRNKFDKRYVLESIIHPNRAISDQYQSSVVQFDNGTVATGIVVKTDDHVLVYPADANAEPGKYLRDQVEDIVPSPTSQMPGGLIDALSESELRDLLAYLMSGGDEQASFFATKAAATE